MHLLPIVLVAIASQNVFSQKRKRQTFTQFFNALTSPDTAAYRPYFTDFVDPITIDEMIENNTIELGPDSLIVINKVVDLINCRFARGLSLSKFHFKKRFHLLTTTWMNQVVYPDELCFFTIKGNKFSGGFDAMFGKGEAMPLLDMQQNTIYEEFHLIADDSYVDLYNNTFDLKAKNREIDMYATYNGDKIRTEKRQIVDFYIDAVGRRFSLKDNSVYFRYSGTSEYIPSYGVHMYLNTDNVVLTGNKFESAHKKSKPSWIADYSMLIGIKEKVKMFELTHNTFQPDLYLQIGYDLNSLRIHNNNFQRVAFDPFKIPDQSNVLVWSDFENANLGLATGDYGITKPFYAATNDQILDKLSFKEILKFYKKLYDEYKSAGDIQSSNEAYIKIKDLETSELRSSYRRDPSFNLWFRVKLNQLLKYYTAYGTDPAQALVASFWIILMFAIFYFFFPSTWDVSSKSRLLQDFKDFIQKNEKGYVKPFFRMSAGFLISLLNAITLSLNAFVTLGFGEIPAKGAAKYVTVVQGFLGWFLLSIFTVSLVNQLLF